MNKQVISFKIPRTKPRAHRALFDDDLPFQHRVEKQKKNQYNRRPKHRNSNELWEE